MFSFYKNLPKRKKLALWFFILGVLLFIVGVLGLAGVIKLHPRV